MRLKRKTAALIAILALGSFVAIEAAVARGGGGRGGGARAGRRASKKGEARKKIELERSRDRQLEYRDRDAAGDRRGA